MAMATVRKTLPGRIWKASRAVAPLTKPQLSRREPSSFRNAVAEMSDSARAGLSVPNWVPYRVIGQTAAR